MRYVEIDNYDLTKLEGLHYKVTAYESLLTRMTSGLHSSEEAFKRIFDEYLEVFKDYEKEKGKVNIELIQKYQKDSDRMWEIDFENKRVIFHE